LIDVSRVISLISREADGTSRAYLSRMFGRVPEKAVLKIQPAITKKAERAAPLF
jgi:hypothetical protein